MKSKIQFRNSSPRALGVMTALDMVLAQSDLSAQQREMIAIRTSQLNGCSFCLELHIRKAHKLGLSERKIHHLHTWMTSELFSEDERMILALTDKLTIEPQTGAPASLLKKMQSFFGEKYLSNIIVAIAATNAWNRIALVTDIQ